MTMAIAISMSYDTACTSDNNNDSGSNSDDTTYRNDSKNCNYHDNLPQVNSNYSNYHIVAEENLWDASCSRFLHIMSGLCRWRI